MTELIFLLIFLALMIGIWLLNLRRQERNLRRIEAFRGLRRAIDMAVEDGTRLHLTLGSTNILSDRTAAAFVGLSMLKRISRIAVHSDNPPITTSGDGALMLLSQDTIRSTFRHMGSRNYDPSLGRITGVTPFSYAAGTLAVLNEEGISTNIMAGSFNNEIALLTSVRDRLPVHTLAGSDNLASQAVLYASADEVLIGEELYAGASYVGAGKMHDASLHAEDVIRWLIIGIMVLGSIAKFAGVL